MRTPRGAEGPALRWRRWTALATRTPATAAALDKHPATAPLVLELQPDGLHIGGSLVTADNVLTAVANL